MDRQPYNAQPWLRSRNQTDFLEDIERTSETFKKLKLWGFWFDFGFKIDLDQLRFNCYFRLQKSGFKAWTAVVQVFRIFFFDSGWRIEMESKIEFVSIVFILC